MRCDGGPFHACGVACDIPCAHCLVICLRGSRKTCVHVFVVGLVMSLFSSTSWFCLLLHLLVLRPVGEMHLVIASVVPLFLPLSLGKAVTGKHLLLLILVRLIILRGWQ